MKRNVKLKRQLRRKVAEHKKTIMLWRGTHYVWERYSSLARHQIRHAKHRIGKLEAMASRL